MRSDIPVNRSGDSLDACALGPCEWHTGISRNPGVDHRRGAPLYRQGGFTVSIALIGARYEEYDSTEPHFGFPQSCHIYGELGFAAFRTVAPHDKPVESLRRSHVTYEAGGETR